jgi:hypothetical protein
VTASPFLASSGGLLLPVIQLTTDAPTRGAAQRLNEQVFKSLSSLIEDQQVKNGIGKGQRIEVKVIDAPEAVLTSPRKKTAAILLLFLCLLGTVAVCHLLEGLRPRQDDAIDGLVDWDVPLAKEPDEIDDEPRAKTFEFTGRRQQ